MYWTIFCLSVLFGMQRTTGAMLDSDLFPYSEAHGHTRFHFGDDGRVNVRFNVAPFRFFNNTHWSIHISGNGVVAFGESGTTPEIKNAADCAPYSRDQQSILVFSSDADNNRNVGSPPAKLLYKETSEDSYLQKAKVDIVKGFPQFKRSLRLNWAFIVTWKDVPRHSTSTPGYLRNTFQVVLTSDGVHSFVLLYFQQLTWSSDQQWAVGFDYGLARPMYTFPGSCVSTTAFKNITEGSNIDSNHPGKYLFRVDSALEIPSKTSSRRIISTKQELTIQPKIVSVMGNVPIIISEGFDLEESLNINCEFHDPSKPQPLITKGIVVEQDVSNVAIICQVPCLYSLGRMQVNLLVTYSNAAAPSLYKGYIFVVKENEASSLPQIFINRTMENALLLSAQWDPSSIKMDELQKLDKGNEGSEETCSHLHETIDIVLLENNGASWRELGKVTPSILNNGVHLSPLNTTAINELLKGSTRQQLPRTFALKAKYTLKNVSKVIVKLLPTNAVVGMDLITTLIGKETSNKIDNKPTNVFDAMCKSWNKREPQPPSDTLPCPVTYSLAEKDWRFMPDTSPHLEVTNPKAISLFIQTVPSPSGAGSQCVYDSFGNLVVGGSSAGRLHRYSPNNRKDYWSHYWHDVLPFLYCCKWSVLKISNCDSYYFKKRPVITGDDYTFPQPARISGVAHFNTFDGQTFTFIGPGEFWATKYTEANADDIPIHSHFNEFKLQVRIEEYSNDVQDLRIQESHSASVLTSLVMQDITNGNSVKVQASYNSGNIAVLLNGENINVRESDDDDDMKTEVYLENFKLYQDEVIIQIKSKNQIIITFGSGIAISLMSSGGGLHMIISACHDLKNNVEGLLGDFDNDKTNDIKFADRSVLNENHTIYDIHSLFGLKWQVKKSETLFYYATNGKSYENFNPDPTSESDDISVLYHLYNNETSLETFGVGEQEFCNGLQECNFDYAVTRNVALVESGTGTYFLYNDICTLASKVTYQCKVPQIVHGSLVFSTIALGSNISISCDSGHKFYPSLANPSFTCMQNNDLEAPKWINIVSNKSIALFSCVPENDQRAETLQTIPTKATTKVSSTTQKVAIKTTTTTQPTTLSTSPAKTLQLQTSPIPDIVRTAILTSTTNSVADSTLNPDDHHSLALNEEVSAELPAKSSNNEKNSGKNSSMFVISILCVVVIGLIIVAIVTSEYLSCCKPIRAYTRSTFRRRSSQNDHVELEL